MALTKEQLHTMDEAELRTSVLIPLFKAMGFRDVRLYHGGAQEQGKDIVMWREGDVRERLNYAVVAKAESFTGQAKSRGGRRSRAASEVDFQVRQAIHDPFMDPISHTEQKVERCIVVSSKPIPKEAVIALSNGLGDDFGRITDFIDGDKLWELIQRHLPAVTVMETLHSVRQTLDAVSPDFHVLPEFTPSGIGLRVEPKSTGASAPTDFSISGKFVFPRTPDGKEMLRKFEQHLATGAPLTVPAPYLEGFEPPDFLKPLLDGGSTLAAIQLGPRTLDQPVELRLEVYSVDGRRVMLNGLAFRVTQIGTDELTLNSLRTIGLWSPWSITIAIAHREKALRLKYQADYAKASARQWADGLRFEQALAHGGTLKLIHAPTDLFLASGLIPPGLYNEPSEDWIQLLEKVALIQNRKGVFINVPRRDITGEEWEQVLRSAEALEHGYVERNTSSIRFGISKKKAKLLLELRNNDRLPGITMTDHETVEVFGKPVSLGRVLHVLEGFTLNRSRAAEVRMALGAAGGGESVDVDLDADPAGTVRTYYLDWLTEEQRKQIPARFLEEPNH